MPTKCGIFVVSVAVAIAGCSGGEESAKAPSAVKSPTPQVAIGTPAVETAAAGAEPDRIRPYPIVMYDQAEAARLKPYADRVAHLMETTAQPAKHNPVCCVWLEFTGWTPNPGSPGYTIINQPGGSIIRASDEDQMRLAVERFETSADRHADHIEVPLGLMTNYSVRE